MAGVRNLTQVEAAERARLLEVTGYDITLDLTDGHGNPGDGTFRSTTVITFRCTDKNASSRVPAWPFPDQHWANGWARVAFNCSR